MINWGRMAYSILVDKAMRYAIKLFNTTGVTILLYGCESWVISQDMENKINAITTSCYRVMLNINRIWTLPSIPWLTSQEQVIYKFLAMRIYKFIGWRAGVRHFKELGLVNFGVSSGELSFSKSYMVDRRGHHGIGLAMLMN